MEKKEGRRPRKEGSRPLVRLLPLRLGLRPDVLPALRGLSCRPCSSSGPSFHPSVHSALVSFPSSRPYELLLHRIFPSSSCPARGRSSAGQPPESSSFASEALVAAPPSLLPHPRPVGNG